MWGEDLKRWLLFIEHFPEISHFRLIDDQEVVNYMGRFVYKVKLGEETQTQVMEHFNVLAAVGVSVSVTGLDSFLSL